MEQLKSMTGYGRASKTQPKARLDVEIQQVNRRHLEINLSLPKTFFRFETEIRKWIAARVARGQLNLYLSWKSLGAENSSISIDLPLAKALKAGWESVAKETGIAPQITLDLLARENILRHEEQTGDENEMLAWLKEVVEQALDALDEGKRKEGEALSLDFKHRLGTLQKMIETIEASSKDATTKYRQKLSSRLEELFSGQAENEEKVLKEVAIFAERIDITEELLRFKTHAKAFLETLTRPLTHEGKGKRLEFILQELLREINTIGSKSNDQMIASLVVDAKCELEKMREQVQNIE